jgi:hypothetical protein
LATSETPRTFEAIAKLAIVRASLNPMLGALDKQHAVAGEREAFVRRELRQRPRRRARSGRGDEEQHDEDRRWRIERASLVEPTPTAGQVSLAALRRPTACRATSGESRPIRRFRHRSLLQHA